jgi:hypothetical protein
MAILRVVKWLSYPLTEFGQSSMMHTHRLRRRAIAMKLDHDTIRLNADRK